MDTTDRSPSDDDSGARSRSKVARVVAEYDLDGIGDELERYWTCETDERMSLRELAEYFNESLLGHVLQRNATSTLDGEAENYYRLLTDDDVSSGKRVEATNRLERHGVDVERLQSDFVSRQAIHTYLTRERGATYEESRPSEADRVEDRIETISRLKSRLTAVAERALSTLSESTDGLSGDAQVLVLVQVQCEHCDDQYPITEYLSDGGCDCQDGGQ
jgi:hypothetical protein